MGKSNTTTDNQLMETVLAQVAEAVKNGRRHDKIETVAEYSKETNKIIIPVGMTKKEAANDLMLQWNNEEQVQDFVTMLDGWEWKDCLRAFRNVLEEEFGWIKGVTSFWSTPTEIDIVTNIINGRTISEKAFVGQVAFPAWEDAKGEVGVSKGKVYIQINAKRKFSPVITEFFNKVRNYLQTQSIYRGKAVVVTKQAQFGGHVIDLQITELLENDKIVLNSDEELTVKNFVVGDLGSSGKRCFLFTGTYGNGKTETAMRVGIQAIKQGISFFYVKQADLLVEVLAFAKNYEPCVIFLEDVDETTSGEQRDERMNQILNTLDGVQTKGRDIMVLFTTNHEKRINPALRRPGRIDLMINFSNPTRDTVKKIYHKFFDGYAGCEEIDYELVMAETPDAQGAVIAEIAKRAIKLANRDGRISTDHVRAAQASMKYQIEFMKDDVDQSDEVKQAFETVREYQLGNRDFQ